MHFVVICLHFDANFPSVRWPCQFSVSRNLVVEYPILSHFEKLGFSIMKSF